ncbi:MAG: hypothetical protein ACKO96_21150, partial [Flammeovirgaceae bacterium]
MQDIFVDSDVEDQELLNNQKSGRKRLITDREFKREMTNLKRRGTSAVPPKKSNSAYNIFGKEKRAEIMLRNPNTKVCEVVKEMAATWAGMSNNQKSSFVDRANHGKCYKKLKTRLAKEQYQKELI